MAYSHEDWEKVYEGLLKAYPDPARAAQVLVRKLLDYLQSAAFRGQPLVPATHEAIVAYGDAVFARVHAAHPEVRPDVFTQLFSNMGAPRE